MGKLIEKGRWETLSEHSEALIKQREQSKRIKLELNEHELIKISDAIASSNVDQTPIKLMLFNTGREEFVYGVVERIDTTLRRVVVRNDEEICFVNMNEIIGVYV